MEGLSPVLILGILLTTGFLAGLAVKAVGLPRIIGYIIIGILFSKGLLGSKLNISTEGWAPVLTDVALGIIAYLVGSEINLKNLRKEEKTVVSAVLGQSIGVMALLSVGLWGLSSIFSFLPQINFYQALVFGAVATATAPATSISIIEEYGAKGKLTDNLLGVIAIDDAVGIIFFTLILGISANTALTQNLLTGLKELGGSVLLGGGLGALLGLLGKYIKSENLRLSMIIGFIFVAFGVSKIFHFSMLLSCMTLGLVSELFYPRKQKEWLLPLQHLEELVFLLFFTLAGIKFKLDVFLNSVVLILIYMVLRVAGKYFGAYLGMSLAGSNKKTRRLLGLCLFPQAGVAIGLAILASNQPGFKDHGQLLVNLVLGSTIIFALISPLITKYALKKAGDIKGTS